MLISKKIKIHLKSKIWNCTSYESPADYYPKKIKISLKIRNCYILISKENTELV